MRAEDICVEYCENDAAEELLYQVYELLLADLGIVDNADEAA